MNQEKIGKMIRELRKESGMTQEQMAEKFGVARRTVSRWETGVNLPDLDLLIEMSDCFDVDLRELLDGEKKNENMNPEMKETVMKVAEFSNEQKAKVMARMHLLFIAGVVFAMIGFGIEFAIENPTPFQDFVMGMCQGITFGMLILGVLITSRSNWKIAEAKQRFLRKG